MAANSSATPELPNPFTPLAFLDPAIANEYEVARYVIAVTIGVYMWDIAINLLNDRVLLFKHKIQLPTIAYYLSRVFALSYILADFVLHVSPVDNCQSLQIAIGITWAANQAFTSSLFFLRVRAVYHQHKFIQGIFFVLWILASVTAISVPIGIKGAHIGSTKHCIESEVPWYTAFSPWALLVFDSAVFIAITYRILADNIVEESFEGRVKAFFGRGSIAQLSRSLLLGGQHYYLIALCGNILLPVLINVPSVSPTYRGMATVPLVAISTMMACIVFRKIKLGHISHDGTTYTSNATSSSNGNLLFAPRYCGRLTQNEGSSYALRSGPRGIDSIHVDITKTIETDGQTNYPLNDLKSRVDNQV